MWRKSASSLLALALAAAGGLAAQAPRDSALSQAVRERTGNSLGRLAVPEAAGRSTAAVTARDDAALVQAIEHQIRCTCGCNLDVFTCRTTDFTCTTSPAMHQLVLARLDSGMSEAQVLASFQKQYGEMIFMAPPRHGFNWAAYLMPFIGLGVGIGLVVGVVKRWSKPAPAAAPEPAAAAEAGATPEEMEQLQRALEKFEA